MDFLEENNFAVTISLDGTKKVNDSARVMVNGGSSYDAVFNNLDLWSNYKSTLGLEVTINNYHIKNYNPGIVSKWIDDLRRLNFKVMAMYAVVTDDLDTKISDYKVLKSIFYEAVDYWFEKIMNEKELKCADTFIIGMINNILLKEYKRSCSVHNSLAINPDGEVYPCQSFCQSGSYCMGNILDKNNSERDKTLEKLMKTDRIDVTECQNCWIHNFCSSWCKGNSENFCGNLTSTVEIQCLQAKITAERIIHNLALLISKGREEIKRFANIFNKIKENANVYAVEHDYAK